MFIPLTPVSEIFGTLFEALFLEETLRERIPSQERIPSRASWEHEHQGPAGHIVFLRSGKLRGTRASGRFNVRSLFLSLRSVPCTLPYDEAGSPISEPDTTGELSSASGGSQYEVSFLFLCSVVFCLTLDLFQHNCWDHLWHFGGGFPILDCSVTVRVLSMLILEVQTTTRPSF